MKVEPIPPNNPIFGIYIKTTKTKYGYHHLGKYKGNNIEIYYDNRDKTKLYYVSDSIRKWIKSKLIYFENGIKKVIRSNAR